MAKLWLEMPLISTSVNVGAFNTLKLGARAEMFAGPTFSFAMPTVPGTDRTAIPTHDFSPHLKNGYLCEGKKDVLVLLHIMLPKMI